MEKNQNKLLLFIFGAILMVSCESPIGERIKKDGYTIVEIEGCEYIEVSSMKGANNGYYSLTHKGNCKNKHTFVFLQY